MKIRDSRFGIQIVQDGLRDVGSVIEDDGVFNGYYWPTRGKSNFLGAFPTADLAYSAVVAAYEEHVVETVS